MNNEFFNGLTRLINKLISLDKESTDELSKYRDKHINVELINTSTVLCIQIKTSGISISSNCTSKADVTVRGTPLDLLNYLIGMNQADTVKSGALEISGDISLAQTVQSIIKGLDIDWEDQLAALIGDTMAHKLGRTLTGTASFLKNSHGIIKNNLSEYLRYETGILINSEEHDEFSHSVDRLRDDTARLKVRIDRIYQFRKEL